MSGTEFAELIVVSLISGTVVGVALSFLQNLVSQSD